MKKPITDPAEGHGHASAGGSMRLVVMDPNRGAVVMGMTGDELLDPSCRSDRAPVHARSQT